MLAPELDGWNLATPCRGVARILANSGEEARKRDRVGERLLSFKEFRFGLHQDTIVALTAIISLVLPDRIG